MCIADNIISFAKGKGIKQTYICKQLGLDPSYLRTVKRDGTNIPEERLQLIADILGTTAAYLKGKTDDPSPQKEKSPSNDGLSENEKVMLQLFRTVPEDRQTELLSLIESALKMNGLLQ